MHLQEGNPPDVLDESVDEVALAEAVLEQREANVTRDREDDCAGEPDLKRVKIIPVNFDAPAEKKIVEHG